MDKLGFVLKATDSGEREIFHINKDASWAGHIADVRQDLSHLRNFDATNETVILIRFLGKDGCLLALIKARPQGSGKRGDNTSAWIHIPAKVNLSGKDICKIIDRVKNGIFANNEISTKDLNALFSKDFGTKNNVLQTAVERIYSMKNGPIGFRFYGKGTEYELDEILGEEIAQLEYNKFKGIFLINSQSNIKPSDGSGLIKESKRICILDVPKVDYGYIPYVNNVQFTAPIELPYFDSINITLKKEGYKEINREYPHIKESKHDWEISIMAKECLRQIRYEWFKIFDEDSNDVLTSKVRIAIDGNLFNNEDALYIVETADKLHEIDIECEGYKQYREKIEVTTDIQIHLEMQEYEKKYTLPQEEGEGLLSDAEITIKTKKGCNMPIKGYYSRKGYLYHKKNIMERLKWFCLGFISLLVVVVIYVLFHCRVLQSFWAPSEKKKIEKTVDPINNDVSDKKQVEDINWDGKAIEYMNNNTVWRKDSLDNYEITKGLFDAMNTLNLDLLTSEKYLTLKDKSNKFRSIVDAANMCRDDSFDEQALINNWRALNSNSSDKQIDVDSYIKCLKDAPNEVEKENISRITNRPKKEYNKASSAEPTSSNKRNRDGAKVE